MPLEIITAADLATFKQQLIEELKKLFDPANQNTGLLKTSEVCKLLRTSPGTLQTLRKNKIIRYTKIGGTLYYEYEDIQKLLK